MVWEDTVANTDNINLNKPDRGSSNWDTPLNANFDLVDKYIGRLTTIGADLPGNLDDDFSEATLDPKWTEYNNTNLTIVTNMYNKLHMVAAEANNTTCGIYQTAPAGAFTVTAQFQMTSAINLHYSVTPPLAGIMLMEGTSSTDKKAILGLYGSHSDALQLYLLSDDTTIYNEDEYSYNPINVGFYKVVYDGVNWDFLCSGNGISWNSILTGGTPVAAYFTPAYVGLGLFSAGNSAISLDVDWFKVEET